MKNIMNDKHWHFILKSDYTVIVARLDFTLGAEIKK
jgi:hypothetical protein